MLAIRYFSRTGNTKKMAKILAKDLGIEAYSIDTPFTKGPAIDKLLLGGGIYMMSLDKKLTEFAETLKPSQVKEVVMFGTAGGVGSIEKKLAKVLEKNQITVADSRLFLHGLAPGIKNITKHQQKEIFVFADQVKK